VNPFKKLWRLLTGQAILDDLEKTHDTSGKPCWCEPEVITVTPAKAVRTSVVKPSEGSQIKRDAERMVYQDALFASLLRREAMASVQLDRDERVSTRVVTDDAVISPDAHSSDSGSSRGGNDGW